MTISTFLRRLCTLAPPAVLAACASAPGDGAPPAPESFTPLAAPATSGTRVPFETLTLDSRGTVETIAFTPGGGELFIFLDAPGRRVSILSTRDGREFTIAGLINRPGQVYCCIMWSATRGAALQGGTDGSVLLETTDSWATSRETVKLDGKFVKMFDISKNGQPAVILTGSDRGNRGACARWSPGAAPENAAVFLDRAPRHVSGYIQYGSRKFLIGGSEGRGSLFISETAAGGTAAGGVDQYRLVETGTLQNLLGIAFDEAGNGLIVGDHGECLRSQDGGLEWRPVLTGTEQPLASVVFIKNRTAILCGREGTVFITKDAGATFTAASTGRRDDFFALHPAPDGSGAWAAGARSALTFVAVP